jgi:hypothetical protein
MERDHEDLAFVAIGTFASVALGFALVPLREITTASNLTFPFLALTIVVAELGGPRAVVCTAVASALSLDFFLTRPYLTLTIAGTHDIVAFLGLAACGLVVAALSARRRSRVGALERDRSLLRLLHASLDHLQGAGPVEPVAERILDTARASLPVSGLAIRDRDGRVLAATRGLGEPAVPPRALRPDTLLAADAALGVVPAAGLALPPEGGRMPIHVRGHEAGWLDLWGTGAPASAQARRTLGDIGRLVGWMLTTRRGARETST